MPTSEFRPAPGTAVSFGTDAARYDRARPGYPAALVERVLPGPGPRDVLDVGCGTGISARPFRAAGHRVLGIDPDPRMTDLARAGGLAVQNAALEDWDPAGRLFDAVVCGQAWHWVDPVAGPAAAAAALRPGGRLAVFWNALDPPADLAEDFARVHERVLPDLPAMPRRTGAEGYTDLASRVAADLTASGAFAAPEPWRHTTREHFTREAWLELLPTGGLYTRLPRPVLDALLEGVGAAIDAAGGAFPVHRTTVAVIAERT
ncbi:class I SAM-dependent methyltransferase [Nocardiopsis sp. NPDC006139]|uniref:class I SAM-dependent methyltransferase n=1 Tax=Nocardiopsis sp. NPDC006139 TaxID=3154578 RepID=UPI0033B47447